MARPARKDVGAWGRTKIGPGEARDLTLIVSRTYGGTRVRVPVYVWRGKKAGPTVFISAAVHGDEMNGTGTIRHIILERPFDLRAGSLILVPVVNILGFERLSRYSPDRRDLNRSFPGKKDGSVTSRLARVIHDNIVARSDYGIDLHTAAARRTNFPNARADMSQEATARLATLFGAELTIDNEGPEGSLRRSAVAAGCATLILEAGEIWKVEPGIVEYTLRGIRNVLVGLGMIEGEVVDPAYRIVAEETKWIRASTGGFLTFHAQAGDQVKKGDPIATNTSLVGGHQAVVRAPKNAVVLGMTTLPAVSPGDPICNLAFPSDKALKKMRKAIGKLPGDDLLTRLRADIASSVYVSELDDYEA